LGGGHQSCGMATVFRQSTDTVEKNWQVHWRNLSKFTRVCLRHTLRELLVVSSDKLGVYTFPRSIPQDSVPVSVPIRGRLSDENSWPTNSLFWTTNFFWS
jgi:hypothetical protein